MTVELPVLFVATWAGATVLIFIWALHTARLADHYRQVAQNEESGD